MKSDPASAQEFVKIQGPHQLEPGDSVYEVVRFGDGDHGVKYNELQVKSVERGAVVAVRRDGSRGRPVKVSFNRLVIRPPIRPPATVSRLPVLERAGDRAVQEVTAAPPRDEFAAWVEMTRDILSDVRLELARCGEARARVAAELQALEEAHRKQVESLEAQLSAAREAHARDRAVATLELDQIEARKAAAEARVAGIDAMLKAVGP